MQQCCRRQQFRALFLLLFLSFFKQPLDSSTSSGISESSMSAFPATSSVGPSVTYFASTSPSLTTLSPAAGCVQRGRSSDALAMESTSS